MDLVSLERMLARQKTSIRRNYETARNRVDTQMAGAQREAFYETLAAFQQFGDDDMRAMIDRIREY